MSTININLSANTIYSGDGTLAGNRNVDANGYQLQISNAGVFIVDGSFAPSGGNGTFTLNGYGTSGGDLVEKITSDSGVIRESYGNKDQHFYGDTYIQAGKAVSFNGSLAYINKSGGSNGIEIFVNGAGHVFGWSNGQQRSTGNLDTNSIEHVNSNVNSYFAQSNGSYQWQFGKTGNDGAIRGNIGAGFSNTELVKLRQTDGAVIFSNGVTKHNGLTTTQRDALTPEVGMEIYNTTLGRKEVYSDFWGWIPVEGFTPDMGFETMDDLYNNIGSIWVTSLLNSGTTAITGATGILAGGTGTAGNGGCLYRTNLTSVSFGSSIQRLESLIKVPTNSDITNTFQVLSGFIDSQTTNQTNGAYFLYDAQGVSTGSTASGNWQCVTVKAGVRTFTTTTVAIDNTNFQKLRIDVNSAGTEVKFYIAGTLVATHTTNVPVANMGSGNYIQKSAGTTARTFQLDFIRYKTKYNTAR